MYNKDKAEFLFMEKGKIYLVGRFSEELHNRIYHGNVLLSHKLSYITI